MYDTIIVGMGPAGMSASVYAKRSGLKTLILEKNVPGGLINTTNLVDNYLGFDNITGPDLAFNMFEHVKNNEVEYKIEEVTKVIKENDIFEITTNKNTYKTKTIILAGGRHPRKIEQEEKLKKLQISRCSICDAPLYKNKKVLVIGGGNSAFEEGLYLSEFASELIIVVKNKIKAEQELVEEAKKRKNIKILENETVSDIEELEKEFEVTLKKEKIKVDGIFSYIGYIPSTEYLSSLEILDENGYIIAQDTKTKVPGIYACGDIIKKEIYQIITATSEGAIAAINAKEYITSIKEK